MWPGMANMSRVALPQICSWPTAAIGAGGSLLSPEIWCAAVYYESGGDGVDDAVLGVTSCTISCNI